MRMKDPKIIWFKDVNKKNMQFVGGKGSQIVELIREGFDVPNGFIISSAVYDDVVDSMSTQILDIVSNVDLEDTNELEKASDTIQYLITITGLDEKTQKEIMNAYKKLGKGNVAVRSSATIEDLKAASFAGQESTYLNVTEKDLIKSVKKCMASIFTARTIFYRKKKNFDQMKGSMSVIVQTMVNAKKAGISFSINPVTNNKEEIVIEAVKGLGNTATQGVKTPNNYMVNKNTGEIRKILTPEKFILTDKEIEEISNMTKKVEKYHNFPQDVEWAIADKLYVLQSRPVTTLSPKAKNIKFDPHVKCKALLCGMPASIGKAKGKVAIVKSIKDLEKVKKGDILVTATTSPNFVPVMQKAIGIVTDAGGITSHSAVVARELGVPCIVGTTYATKKLKDGDKITIDAETGHVDRA